MIIKKFSILRFPHAARISNFHIFLADFSPDFKHIVVPCLCELTGLLCISRNVWMSTFQVNWNIIIHFVSLDIVRTVDKGQIDKFYKIDIITLIIWNNPFPNSDWLEIWTQYRIACIKTHVKISAQSNSLVESYIW
jgi:hypothetical protein